MIKIPENWQLMKLGDCCEIILGSTPQRNKKEYWDGDIPWVTPKDLSHLNQPVLEDTPEKITEAGYKSCSTSLLPQGSILFSSRAPIGYVAIVGKPMCTNQGFKSLIPGKNVYSPYLYWCMKKYTPNIQALGTGTTFKEVSKGVIEKFEIPIPPIEEQRRIAEILDQADGLRRKRQEAIRLTEELLRATFLDMFGDPVTNPKGWEISPLGEIAQFIGGGTPSRKNPNYFEGNICWATSKDMKPDILMDTEEHITEEAIKNSATKLVSPECLLIVVKSKILLRRLPVARAVVPICFGQDLKAIIPFEKSMNRYLHRHLIFGEKFLLRQARGVNTEGLTLEHLRSYPVMIPPQSAIHRFVELDINCEKRFQLLESFNKAAESLFNSLLQRAFRGEL